jgi:ATP-dependent Clp protease ATP-binding subunit ClpX
VSAEIIPMAICAFCSKHAREVEILIAGAGVMVCDRCVDTCSEIVKEARSKKAAKEAAP